MDRTGVRTRKGKRGVSHGVDTTVRGVRIIEGGFPTRAAAQEWLYKLRTDPHELAEYLRTRAARQSPTVAEVMTEYQEARKKVRTADRHEQYALHLEPLKQLRAEEVRQRHIDEYVDTRTEQGAAAKTIYNELAFLRSCMHYAYENDRLTQRPRFKLRKPHCARTRVAREDEAQRLEQLADVPLRKVLAAAWGMGMRRSEILEARWKWASELRREITLPVEVTKTDTERVVVVSAEIWALLCQEPRHPEFIFCKGRRGRNGRGRWEVVQWTKRTLRTAFEELRDRADASDLWLHDLRRSCASVAQERGHAPAAVQRVGGWQDAGTMARHYSHASRAAVERVVQDLGRVLLGSTPEVAEQGEESAAGFGGTEAEPKQWN